MTEYFEKETGRPVKFRCWVTLHPHTRHQEVKAVVSYPDYPGIEILLTKDELEVKQ